MRRVCCFGRNTAASHAELVVRAAHGCDTFLSVREPCRGATALLVTPLARDVDSVTVPLFCHLTRKMRPPRPEAERALALNARI